MSCIIWQGKLQQKNFGTGDVPVAEERVKQFDGLGGRAFGISSRYDVGDVSLSDSKLRELSKVIQTAYEKGKTVFKTVVSFSTDYLKKYGIIPEDLEVRNKGDMAGHVDQAKIRLAVMERYAKNGWKLR